MTHTISSSDGTRISIADGVGTVLMSFAFPLPNGGASIRSIMLAEREACTLAGALAECVHEARQAAADRTEAEKKIRDSEGA